MTFKPFHFFALALAGWLIGIAEIAGVLVMGSGVVIFWRRFAPKHDRGGK